MRTPVTFSLDSDVGAAVLRYSNSSTRQSLRVGDSIVFDIGEDNELLDIELLDLSAATLDQAIQFAATYHCMIPEALLDELSSKGMVHA